MRDLGNLIDEIPVTLLVALAYVSAALLSDPGQPGVPTWHDHGLLTPMAAVDEPWRLLTHAFLHGGLLHLLFNLHTLIWLGPPLERSLGSIRFAIVYLVSALGGGIAVCLLYDPRQPVVGGSGALFGMFGALIARNMRAGRHAFACFDYAGPRQLLSLIGVNLLIGFLIPVISNTAHIGGLLAGWLITFVFLDGGRSARAMRRWQVAITAMFAGLLFSVLVPVTRWDWLWNQAIDSKDPARAQALRAAAVQSYFRRTDVGDGDLERMIQVLFPPERVDDAPPAGADDEGAGRARGR